MKTQYTNQIDTSQGVKFVVYGEAKTGKTRLAATLPSPFIFSTERGLLSLRAERIPYANINTIDELVEAYIWATSSKEANAYRSIVLDSISDMGEIVLAAEAKKHGKNGFGKWTETSDKIMQMYRDFRNIQRKHVYFIAKQEWDKDDVGQTKFRPSMPGKELTKQLPYMFDGIFQLCTFRTAEGQLYNALRTRRDNLNEAGDRSGKLLEWEEPHLGKIIQKIMSN